MLRKSFRGSAFRSLRHCVAGARCLPRPARWLDRRPGQVPARTGLARGISRRLRLRDAMCGPQLVPMGAVLARPSTAAGRRHLRASASTSGGARFRSGSGSAGDAQRRRPSPVPRRDRTATVPDRPPDEFMAALEPLVAQKNSTGMAAGSVDRAIDVAFSQASGEDQARHPIRLRGVSHPNTSCWSATRTGFRSASSSSRISAGTIRSRPTEPSPTCTVDGVFVRAISITQTCIIVGAPTSRSRPVPSTIGMPTAPAITTRPIGAYRRPSGTSWNNPKSRSGRRLPRRRGGARTVHSVFDVTTYVNKIIRYETQQPQNMCPPSWPTLPGAPGGSTPWPRSGAFERACGLPPDQQARPACIRALGRRFRARRRHHKWTSRRLGRLPGHGSIHGMGPASI